MCVLEVKTLTRMEWRGTFYSSSSNARGGRHFPVGHLLSLKKHTKKSRRVYNSSTPCTLTPCDILMLMCTYY